MRLKGKHIIIGITGSIAAYKAAMLVRLLVKEGAEVKVVMTPLAKEFITPLTMATLSRNPILVDFYNPENGDWNSHVDLGLWADLYLIAPATANTIAKMAHGVADNLLLTTYLSAKCPVMVAPAMDLDMYRHPSTQKNIEVLRGYGNLIVEPASGELASGLSGKGRMEEPEAILEIVVGYFASTQALRGVNALVTSGPTFEPIDPVRFIGNHSSGAMGTALAECMARHGAHVTFITGPARVLPKHPSIEIVPVTTAEEMYQAALAAFPNTSIAIMAAAVADYTPTVRLESKLKRVSEEMAIQLKPTKDIAAALGKIKGKDQVLIGFALETDNEYENARKKLKSKNLDAVVLNSLRDQGAGFGCDTNKVTIIDRKSQAISFDRKPKPEVAHDIVNYIIKEFIGNRG
jgi:phosphopantothenoylcysteine decarboxylase/phosphopantothenate--cysteine ligase